MRCFFDLIVLVTVAACAPNPEFDGPGGSSERVEEGLVLLYTFDEGDGVEVFDRSGIEPAVDLFTDEPQGVAWESDSLFVEKGSGLVQRSTPSKVFDACRSSNELTAELWIRSADVFPYASASVLTWSAGESEEIRNLALLQTHPGLDEESRFEWQLSSSRGAQNVDHPLLNATTRWTHLILTHDSGGETHIYVDGMLHSTVSLEGDFSSWAPDAELTLGFTPFLEGWPGWYDLVALYCRALDLSEIRANFNAGRGYERAG